MAITFSRLDAFTIARSSFVNIIDLLLFKAGGFKKWAMERIASATQRTSNHFGHLNNA
jgi:hypothetical protein